MKIVDVRVTKAATKRIYKTLTGSIKGAPTAPPVVDNENPTVSEFFFLEFFTDTGHVGLGEISDIPGEFTASSAEVRSLVLEAVQGEEPFEVNRIHRRLVDVANRIGDHRADGTFYNITSCAVDIALFDLMGKATGLPAAKLAGGIARDKVWVSWVVYIRDAGDAMIAELQDRKRQGFTAFKLKVGHNIDQDEARIKLFREVMGYDAQLKIDPNSAWSEADAIANLKRLEPYKISGVETPVPYLDILGHARVKRKTGVPVIEHVHDAEYALALIQVGGLDVFNVSTVGAGGISRARKVLSLAEEMGIGALLGSTVELGIGTAAQLHLAASSPNISWSSDLIGPLMYVDDVVAEPWQWHPGGYLEVTSGPGLGVTLDHDRLKGIAIPG